MSSFRLAVDEEDQEQSPVEHLESNESWIPAPAEIPLRFVQTGVTVGPVLFKRCPESRLEGLMIHSV